MHARLRVFGVVCGMTLAALAPLRAQQAQWNIPPYSGLKNIDPSRLVAGEIIGSRIPTQGSNLAISVETLFVVPITPARVAELMDDSRSTPSRAEGGALAVEGSFPVGVPAREEDFAGLQISPEDGDGRFLIKASSTGTGLNLSTLESETLARAQANGPEALTQAWRKLLLQRAQIFQTRGWVGSPSYDSRGGRFNMHQEMVRLLKSQPPILNQFKDSIGAAMTSSLVPGMEAPAYYWGISRVQGDRTYTLGSMFVRKMDDSSYQVVEPTYYVSTKYYTSLILQEIRPVNIEGKPYSLVWRGDFVITPTINFMKGIERIAAENITLLEVRNAVKLFADKCRSTP